MNLDSYVKLLRPHQWLKNFFVTIPAIFSYSKVGVKATGDLVTTFAAFCLFSSSVYIINDILDAENDRLHPRKKFRPIASGKISVLKASIWAGIVFCVALLLASLANWRVLFIGVIYATLNAVYSWYAKHIVLVDVFCIGGGFILRVYAGGAAISVVISPWLMLNIFFLSLFLAFGKRRSELMFSSCEPEKQRNTLGTYTPEMLNFFLISSCTISLVCYALYTIDTHTIYAMRSPNLIYSVPIAAYGLFRYILLLFQQNEDRDIAEVVLSDRPLLSAVLLWLLMVIVTIAHGFIFPV